MMGGGLIEIGIGEFEFEFVCRAHFKLIPGGGDGVLKPWVADTLEKDYSE